VKSDIWGNRLTSKEDAILLNAILLKRDFFIFLFEYGRQLFEFAGLLSEMNRNDI
jgi:hypothetical protein